MWNLLQNQMFRNLISALFFGVIYALVTFITGGVVDFGTIAISTVTYFLVLCLICIIAPKLRKITGYDKEDGK